MNLVRNGEPKVDIFRRLASQKSLRKNRLNKLPEDWIVRGSGARMQRRPKLYVPRLLAHTICGACRGKLVINYGTFCLFRPHEVEADLKHARDCSHFTDVTNTDEYVDFIKKLRFVDWPREKQIEPIGVFTQLQGRVAQLSQGVQLAISQRVQDGPRPMRSGGDQMS